jgi:hypothetical protein
MYVDAYAVPFLLLLLQALLARQYFYFLQRITPMIFPMLRVLFLLLVCTVELYFFDLCFSFCLPI